jgi:hypothetical protein
MTLLSGSSKTSGVWWKSRTSLAPCETISLYLRLEEWRRTLSRGECVTLSVCSRKYFQSFTHRSSFPSLLFPVCLRTSALAHVLLSCSTRTVPLPLLAPPLVRSARVIGRINTQHQPIPSNVRPLHGIHASTSSDAQPISNSGSGKSLARKP